MNMVEMVCFVVGSALAGAGMISMQQARYFDGDRDAHSAFRRRDSSIFHTPRNPYAIRAKRRGWVFIALAMGLAAAGFVARAVVNR